jgi:hypothetical protein
LRNRQSTIDNRQSAIGNRQSAIRNRQSQCAIDNPNQPSAISNQQSAIGNRQSQMDHSEYCRQLEAYLCQKNGGHLVRIVGPAFEKVRGWAEQGVPLKVAYRGIDRYCERHAQRARRRPARIEFCEADVLEQFDDWRRAVGVAAGGAGDAGGPSRKPTLASHIERVVSRLIARRRVGSAAFERQIEMLLEELDRLAGDARRARGETRVGLVERLARMDDELMQVAAAELDDRSAAAARRDATEELAPFEPHKSRRTGRALEAAFMREVRELLDLPTIALTRTHSC